ncbi:MAG: hypothetical protein IJY47_07400 [Clostridia bacterium]|nr:hypothetical protein [Clostridia bacterium]
MKYVIVILLSWALVFSLPSCAKQQEYRDDVSCETLMNSLEKIIPLEYGYGTYGEEHIAFYFEETALPDDLCLRYSITAEDINEVGVFHTQTKEEQRELVKLTEAYLEGLRQEKTAFIGSYAPEELPKLSGSEVKCFGNYTVYAILSEEDREEIFDQAEDILSLGD